MPPGEKIALLNFTEALHCSDLMALQEDYVALFDRGQAMVDLLRLYQSGGFELAVRELPDYVPLFLEFLSQLAADESLPLLRDAMPVLSLLGARLHEIRSAYACLFDALQGLAGQPDNLDEIRQHAAAEEPDATLTNMDGIWEEEAVRFMDNSGACAQSAKSTATATISPHTPRKRPQPHSV